MVAKKNPKQTGSKAATIAGTNLPKKGIPKDIKTVMGSDLAQAPLKKSPIKK